jgi:hypothetical protein
MSAFEVLRNFRDRETALVQVKVTGWRRVARESALDFPTVVVACKS